MLRTAHIEELGPLWLACRTAALSKDAALFTSLRKRADDTAADICRSDAAFDAQWKVLLNYRFDSLQFEAGMADLQRAAARGLVDISSLPMLHEIEDFIRENGEHIRQSRAALEYVNVERSDFQVTGWMRMFNPADATRLDARRIWLLPVFAAVSIARESGQSILFIPEYLANIVGHPSRRELSWHTAGKANGVTHFKPADLPGYAVIDSGGYSGWSSLATARLDDLPLPPIEESRDFIHAHYVEVLGANLSKYSQRPIDYEPNLPARYIFVALQIIDDRTQELAYVPMLDMLEIVADRFRESDTAVVVKRHPKCKSERVRRALGRLQDVEAIEVSQESIHTLIDHSIAVVSVNSGVGSEAILHLRPIYTFGASDYAAVAHSVRSAEEFRALTDPVHPAVSTDDMIRFLHFYRNRYLVRISNWKQLRTAIQERIFRSNSADPFLRTAEEGLP